MPRKPQPWFRFYVETMSDRKIRRLTPTERWAWAGLLAAARESPEPGRLLIAAGEPMTASDLADYADVPKKAAASTIEKTQRLGMLHDDAGVLVVTNFGRRQFLDTDTSTSRTRTHRERSNEQRRNVPTSTVGTSTSRAPAAETENRDKELTTSGEQRPETLPPPAATNHTLTEAENQRRCTAHQNLAEPPPCTGCRTARERADQRDQAVEDRERERRERELEQLRTNCPDCEGTGKILDPATKLPTAKRCTHPHARRSA